MSLRTLKVLKDYYYHWSQTLVPCQIQVLSLICLLTLGSPLLDLTSQARQSRRDQPKPKHKSKRRRIYRSSSSFSSSRSSSLSSHKRSRKSKRSRHSHKKRRISMSSSSSLFYNSYIIMVDIKG